MISIQRGVCGACGTCVAVCKPNALFLHNAALEVNESCNGCGRCANICPLGAIILERKRKDDEPAEK
ncbi:MAG: ferredoxin [Delftia sp.]|nr:ferredoxin [Delftia sp.]